MNKNYWKYWTASTSTNLGDGVSMVAYPWLATLITQDPFEVALVTGVMLLILVIVYTRLTAARIDNL